MALSRGSHFHSPDPFHQRQSCSLTTSAICRFRSRSALRPGSEPKRLPDGLGIGNVCVLEITTVEELQVGVPREFATACVVLD